MAQKNKTARSLAAESYSNGTSHWPSCLYYYIDLH
jgi:hypothetical protein